MPDWLTLSIWTSDWPHFRQNFASSRLGSPHAAQAASRRVPHSSQNTAPTGVSCWHWEQVMRVFDLGQNHRTDGCGSPSLLGRVGQATATRKLQSWAKYGIDFTPSSEMWGYAQCEVGMSEPVFT